MINKLSQVPQISNNFYGLRVKNIGFKKTKTIIEMLICFMNKLYFAVKNFDYREFSCTEQS